jgi:hypothetical protein
MSYEEEDTCMSYEEEDTCMSYEEEDTCNSTSLVFSISLCIQKVTNRGRFHKTKKHTIEKETHYREYLCVLSL